MGKKFFLYEENLIVGVWVGVANSSPKWSVPFFMFLFTFCHSYSGHDLVKFTGKQNTKTSRLRGREKNIFSSPSLAPFERLLETCFRTKVKNKKILNRLQNSGTTLLAKDEQLSRVLSHSFAQELPLLNQNMDVKQQNLDHFQAAVGSSLKSTDKIIDDFNADFANCRSVSQGRP